MAINWNYNAEDYVENDFKPLPVGDHRVMIENAEEATSSSGNDMIKLTLTVSGYASKLFHYIVFPPNNIKLTNQRLGQLFDSFGIQPGNMDCSTWIGMVGAARVKHEIYNGEPQARVSYFIARAKQDKLPPWKKQMGLLV